MSFKIVYQCTKDWIFVGETLADEDPFEPNTYLMPPFSTEVSPPDFDKNKQYLFFDGSEWIINDVKEPEPPPPPTREEIIKIKKIEIELKRQKHDTGGIFALGHWWPSSTLAQQQWSELKGLARDIKLDGGDLDEPMVDLSGETFDWKTLDNGLISVTANIVNAVTNKAIADINKNFKTSVRHKENLIKSPNPEDYDYSDGWTEIWSGYSQ
jgi:hypothetical protein